MIYQFKYTDPLYKETYKIVFENGDYNYNGWKNNGLFLTIHIDYCQWALFPIENWMFDDNKNRICWTSKLNNFLSEYQLDRVRKLCDKIMEKLNKQEAFL